jgi:Helix-turn-helix domain
MCGEGKLNNQQVRELGHPLRFRIMELFSTDAARSLAVADLAADLGVDFAEVSASQVDYHLRRLQHVGLIPAKRAA